MGYIVTIASIILILIGCFILFIVFPFAFLLSLFQPNISNSILFLLVDGLIPLIGGIALIIEGKSDKNKKVKIGGLKIQKDIAALILIVVLFLITLLVGRFVIPLMV